ncbi:MAG: uridine kinase [Rickettsiales bacterium]|nr:uridine kinase [Rickettsiales bacterium]
MLNIIIGISGPSGSGKSLFSKSISQNFDQEKEVVILSEDGYYKNRPDLTFEERSIQNYDHPDAFEHNLLVEHLEKLKNSYPIDTPLYNYVTHLRKEETHKIFPCSVIILEGILLFADKKLCDLIDIKIYMDTDLDVCLSRRIYRDSVERGREVASVITQYNNHVRPMYFKFVKPSRKYADVIVPAGGKNQIAINIMRAKIEKLIEEKKKLCNTSTVR